LLSAPSEWSAQQSFQITQPTRCNMNRGSLSMAYPQDQIERRLSRLKCTWCIGSQVTGVSVGKVCAHCWPIRHPWWLATGFCHAEVLMREKRPGSGGGFRHNPAERALLVAFDCGWRLFTWLPVMVREALIKSVSQITSYGRASSIDRVRVGVRC
jgi:hypothetical protein